jgi:hypothetical protein
MIYYESGYLELELYGARKLKLQKFEEQERVDFRRGWAAEQPHDCGGIGNARIQHVKDD